VRAVLRVLAIVLVAAIPAVAQTTMSPPDSPSNPPRADSESAAGRPWSLSAAVSIYQLHDEPNYAQPTIGLDVEWFHGEARYNYEATHTASLWAGVNLAGEKTIAWELTPMIGAVFGDLDGVAPGYKGSLSWWKLEFYSEGEFVFDTASSSDNFFYNWSEVNLLPVEWFRVGLVTQRTRVYQTERDIQRGLLVGLSYRNVEVATHVFNPDDSAPTVVVTIAWELSRP
jgi:hypothetical protein